MNYESIKALAAARGCRVTDLLALAANNDPFYCGMPAQRERAEWFAVLFERLGFGQGVHVRRIHYAAQARKEVFKPDGKLHENTKPDWLFLCDASKAARNLGLIDARLFVDRRCPVAVEAVEGEPGVSVAVNCEGEWARPRLAWLPEWPRYAVELFEARQGYRIEVWVEKSTMNDILEPLCTARGVTLQMLVGEGSITRVVEQIARLDDRPLRVLYVSDFDPAGQTMPTSVARKIGFQLAELGREADIQLHPVCLTAEQIARYGLPKGPIKDKEKRRGHFEDVHGEGAVELDALEGIHKGEFRRIVTEAIDQFLDPDLPANVDEARADLEADCEARVEEVQAGYAAEVDAIEAEDRRLRKTCAAAIKKLGPVWDRAAEVRGRMAADLEVLKDGVLEGHPLPESRPAREWPDPLFDSRRDYLAQLAAYKRFQGKLAEDTAA